MSHHLTKDGRSNLNKCNVIHTIDEPRVGGGGARCGGNGGAILFVLTFGLRSFDDKLFALPVFVVAVCGKQIP